MPKKKEIQPDIDPAILAHIESADPEYLRLEKAFAKKISNMVLTLEADPADFDRRIATIPKVALVIIADQLGRVTDPRVVAVRDRIRDIANGR